MLRSIQRKVLGINTYSMDSRLSLIFYTVLFVITLSSSRSITMIEKAVSPKEIYNRIAPVIIFEHQGCITKSCKSEYATYRKMVRRIFNTHPAHLDRFLDFVEYDNPQFKNPMLRDYFNVAQEEIGRKSSFDWLNARRVKSKYTAKLAAHIEMARFRIIYFYKSAKLVYQGVRNSYTELLRWVRKFTRQNHIMRMNELDLHRLVKHHDIFSIVRESHAKYFGIFDLVAQTLSPLREKLLFSNLVLMDASMKFDGYNCFHGCFISTRKSKPVEFPIASTEFSTKSLKFWLLDQYFGAFPLFNFDFAHTMLNLDEPFLLWMGASENSDSDDRSLTLLREEYPRVIIARGYLQTALQLMPELGKFLSDNHYHAIKGIGKRFVYLFGHPMYINSPVETDL